jgi:O-antigen/teichoic acid export membrane protein
MRSERPHLVPLPTTPHAAKHRMLRNVGANSAGAVLNSVVPLLALPIYLHALGAEHWGLVSLVALFVSVLSILDAGLSQALVKEFSSRIINEERRLTASADLLLSYERIYAGFALLLSLMILPFSDAIATRWINLGSLPKETGTFTIWCACAMFIAQFPGSIYRTVLIARQEQVKLNKVQSGFLLLRHAGGVAIVSYAPAIQLYLIWQITCTAIETIWMSVTAWREMPGARRQSRWDAAAVGSTARFASFMVFSVLLGAATAMVDKFYISAKLPIAELGFYGIASSVAVGLLRLSYPVFTAVLPRLAELQEDSGADILRLNRQLLLIVTVSLLVFFAAYSLFGRDVLLWWLKSEVTVNAIFATLTLLLVSSALNVFYNIGYTNWVAAGKGRVILFINAASFVGALIITPTTVERFGIVGAAAAMVLMNSIGAVSSLTWIIHSQMRYRRSIRIKNLTC